MLNPLSFVDLIIRTSAITKKVDIEEETYYLNNLSCSYIKCSV